MMSNNIEKAFNELVNEDFDGNAKYLHDFVIDSANNADIGTGKYLLSQVNDDIYNKKHGFNTWTNSSDLELTKEVFKKHPNDYFVYSSADSLGRPLTLRDLMEIKKRFAMDNPLFDLVPNEAVAKKSLEKLA